MKPTKSPWLLEAEFFERVVAGPNCCWIWTGSLNGDGYGLFAANAPSPTRAHRWSYELVKGRIPDGLVLDHLCGNRRCVNPDHLEAVTVQENVRRGNCAGWVQRHMDATHCPVGHEYTLENTNPRRGRRECRACHTARERNRRAAKKELVT